jgi:putative component of membrane protein insertase Oxa1/YidC/SpoIIIJ protein YidD
MIESLQIHGLFYGTFLGVKRILAATLGERDMIQYPKKQQRVNTFSI